MVFNYKHFTEYLCIYSFLFNYFLNINALDWNPESQGAGIIMALWYILQNSFQEKLHHLTQRGSASTAPALGSTPFFKIFYFMSFLKNEMKFTYPKIYPFKLCSSVVFSVFMSSEATIAAI